MTSGIFHGMPHESTTILYCAIYRKYSGQHNQREMMGRLDVMLSNIQLHSCILIGCILYGMVWLLITKGIRIELGAHFDNGRRTAGQPRWHNDKIRFLVFLNKSIIIISLWSLPAVTKHFTFERLTHGFSKSFKTRWCLIPTAAIFIFNHSSSLTSARVVERNLGETVRPKMATSCNASQSFQPRGIQTWRKFRS